MGYPLPDMKGVVLEIAPEDLDDQTVIGELLTHEFLHLLLHPGFAANAALADALVERFTSEWYIPPPATAELRSVSWDWTRLWGSCGFRTDDFAHYRSSPSFETAYIVGSRADLRLIPVTELWSLAVAVLHCASITNTAPTFLRVLQEGRNVASAATIDGMLTSFAGRPLTTGLHGFIMPSGPGRAHFVAFQVLANDNFRVIVDPSQPNIWSDCEFHVEDATVSVNIEVSNGIHEADVAATIAGHGIIDVERITKDLVQRKVWDPKNRTCKLTGVFLGRSFELG